MSGALGRRGFFVRSTVVAFWSHALPPFNKDHLVAKLHCFGLQHFGELEGLLTALGSCKSGCPSCFAEASERGVSPRLEVEGLFCARFGARSFRLLCPCWGVKGINPGFLVLAFSTRTLKSSGVPARRVPAGASAMSMLP